MEFLWSKSPLKQGFIHLELHFFAEGMFCFVFLVNGWIISIPVLACHRYSEWREGSGNHSAKAFWTRLQWHEYVLRAVFSTLLCVSVPFKVLFSVPPSPAHTRSWKTGSILNICNTAAWASLHLSKVILCSSSRKLFQFIKKKIFNV